MQVSSIQFFLTGILLAGIIFFGQRAFRSVLARDYFGSAISGLLALAIIVISGVILFITAPPKTLAQTKWYQESPIGEIFLFVIMLIGMMASYLTKQIEERRAKVQEKRKLGDGSATALSFDVWEFVYPMLVSVITFGAILQGIGEKTIDVQALILSFQTGFFWQTVLARSTPK